MNPVIDRVLAAISENRQLDVRQMRLSQHTDTVVLNGNVESYFAKQMAQETIRGIEGVRRIDNRLRVIEPARN